MSALPLNLHHIYDRNTTVVFPRDLACKFKAKIICKIASFYGGFEKIDRKDWKEFEKKGLSEKIKFSSEEIKELLCRKTPSFVPKHPDIDVHICEWCKSETYKTHAHHYPIPKKNKGKETINICTNCHTEFHYLSDIFHYRIKKEYEKQFLDCYKEFYEECDKMEASL